MVADAGASGATDDALVDLNNVAQVNVNLVSDTAIVATEFTNVAAINITNGVAAGVLTVNNATANTVYGSTSSRSFELDVNYATPASTALLSAQNANIDFVLTNATAVNLATTGDNTVSIDDGAATSITVTGAGALDLTLVDVAGTFKLDASATKGINTIDVGAELSSSDTILGGQGVDTLLVDLNAGTTAATITNVDDVELTFTAAGTYFSGVNTTGINEIDVFDAGSPVVANLVNLQSTVSSIDLMQTGGGVTNIGFKSGTNSDLTVNVGLNTVANQVLGDITITNNAGDLTINSFGSDTLNTIGDLTDSKTTAVAVNAVMQSLVVGDISAVKASTYILTAENGNLLDAGVLGGGLALNGQTVSTIDVIAAADSTVLVDVNAVTADSTVDTVNLLSDATGSVVAVFTETGAGITLDIGAVDASASSGATTIDLSDLTLGTTVTTGEGTAAVSLTQGDDTFTAGSGAVEVTTVAGTDTITLGAGDDVVTLSTGEDSSISSFTAGAGNDLASIVGAGWGGLLDAAGVAVSGPAVFQDVVAGADATFASADMIVFTGVIANDAALLEAIDGTNGQLTTSLTTGANILVAYYDGYSTQLRSVDLVVNSSSLVTAGIIDGGSTLVGINTTALADGVTGNITFA